MIDSKKLMKVIRRVVREEVSRVVRPVINEVLAEHFVKTLGNGYLTEQVSTPAPRVPKSRPQATRQDREKVRQEIINKIAGDDPIQRMIYEDVEPGVGMATIQTSTKQGYVDTDDDDGVDLSQFGFDI